MNREGFGLAKPNATTNRDGSGIWQLGSAGAQRGDGEGSHNPLALIGFSPCGDAASASDARGWSANARTYGNRLLEVAFREDRVSPPPCCAGGPCSNTRVIRTQQLCIDICPERILKKPRVAVAKCNYSASWMIR